MKKFFKILYDATVDAIATILLFIESNLINIANIINVFLPFAMYFIGKGEFTIGIEIIIPIIAFILIYYARSIANRIGKGITVPVPEKRFTEVDDDGEVSIENNRLQELLLYTADLEDWLQKKGLL